MQYYLTKLPYDLQNELFMYTLKAFTIPLDVLAQKKHQDNFRSLFDLKYCDVLCNIFPPENSLQIWKTVIQTYVTTLIDVGVNWKAWRNLYYALSENQYDMLHFNLVNHGFNILLVNILTKTNEVDYLSLLTQALSCRFPEMFITIYEYILHKHEAFHNIQHNMKDIIAGTIRANNTEVLRYLVSKNVNVEKYIDINRTTYDIDYRMAHYLIELGIKLPSCMY